LEETAFSTVTVKKLMARPLETQDHCALELFAPELIHESRNCSNVYSPPPDSSRRETFLLQRFLAYLRNYVLRLPSFPKRQQPKGPGQPLLSRIEKLVK
jgi:hypothetical protein